MILHKDGQSNLTCEDSIEAHSRLAGEMGVVLCNPPFGEKSIEKRPEVLREYDLGHIWEQDAAGKWIKTDALVQSQQLGLLFLERCYKLLDERGRLAIILPEGYLCTPSYGHVRQWVLDRLRVLALIELPRRIFVKSNADLRSNVLVAQKISGSTLKKAIASDYPIFADMVRKIGFKMGKGYSPLYVRDPETGIEIRNEENELIIDTDFRRISRGFEQFTKASKWDRATIRHIDASEWSGARISDVLEHINLDLKPRRLMPKALENVKIIEDGLHATLSDIADVVTETTDIIELFDRSKLWRPVAGQDIRAVEAVVTPSNPVRGWQIEEQKDRKIYRLKDNDIIVGLVRPERRNVGLLISDGDDIVGMPDGIAVVRLKPELAQTYSQQWLFAALRSEPCRLQLWTESGGTSYGKLTLEHIQSLKVPIPDEVTIKRVTDEVSNWADSMRASVVRWSNVGTAEDRKPIINSSGFGLIDVAGADVDDFDDE